MIEESAYDELDRFVNGNMSGNELAGFVQKLDSDDALRNEVEWIKSTMIAMSFSGRAVMKQHIAASMSGTIENYTPSKNAKSFWKKWWWAVSLFVVAGAVAVAVVQYWPQSEHEGDERHDDELPVGGGPEGAAPISDSALFADSCAKLDSILLQMENDSSVKDTVEIEFGIGFGEDDDQKLYYDIAKDEKVAPVAVTGSYAVPNFSWGSGSKNDVAMPVALNIRKSPPYTYKLDSVLTLNSNYTSAKKMRFQGSGDTILMTDSSNNTYTLLRNRGNLPLVKNPKPVSK